MDIQGIREGAGKDTVSAQGQSTEPETYDADIPF